MTATDQDTAATSPPQTSTMRWRALLLAAVSACAACGIVYELALLTLATSLDGGGIVATSLIVAGYVAALGAGGLVVKPLLKRAAITFIAVETLLGIVGGLSAALLYVTFSYLGGSTVVLAVGTALIGGLVGAEVPLLMTLLQRGQTAGAVDTGRVLANLNAADYLGALVGGLAWPFVVLPQLGMIRGAAATGMINLAAAAVVALFLLRRVVSGRELATALAALAAAFALLTALIVGAGGIESTSRQQLYADPIVAYQHSAYQEIVVTRRGDDMRLYLDGGLQFSTRDEYRYTESLVYPVLGDGARSVLVIGGGDGLADRELLRQPGIDKIVHVELDPAVINLARTTMRQANAGALDSPRVDVVIADAMAWLRDTPSRRRARGRLRRRDRRSARRRQPDSWPVVLAGVLHAGDPRSGAQRPGRRAVRQPVLDAHGVLAHGVDHPGRRFRGDALPRRRADVRRLGFHVGPPRRRRADSNRAERRTATSLSESTRARRRDGVRR